MEYEKINQNKQEKKQENRPPEMRNIQENDQVNRPLQQPNAELIDAMEIDVEDYLVEQKPNLVEDYVIIEDYITEECKDSVETSGQKREREKKWRDEILKLRPDLTADQLIFLNDGVEIRDLEEMEEEEIIEEEENAEEEKTEEEKTEEEKTEEEKTEEEIKEIEEAIDRAEERGEKWHKLRNEMVARKELVCDFTDKIKNLIKGGYHTFDEIKMRVDCFSRVYKTWREFSDFDQELELYKPKGDEDPELTEYKTAIEILQNVLKIHGDPKAYDAMKEILATPADYEKDLRPVDDGESVDEKLNTCLRKLMRSNTDTTRKDEISQEFKEFTDAVQNVNPIEDDRADKVREIDQWLLDAYIKKKDNLDESIVFHFLNRPMRERLFAYYLMEHDYLMNVTESTVAVSQTGYRPSLETIKKVGLNLSKLDNVYQKTCQVAPLIFRMGELEQQKELMAEADEYDKDDMELLEKINDIFKEIQELEEANQNYNNCSRLLFIRKRSLKSKVREKEKGLSEKVNDYLNMRVPESTIQRIIKSQEISKAYTVKDLLKDGILVGTGAKALGGETSAILKAVEQLGAFEGVSYGTNALGGLLGIINLSLAVWGIKNASKTFSALSSVDKAGISLELANQVVNPLYAMGSSATGISKTYAVLKDSSMLAATSTAAQVMAVAGVVTGSITNVVGCYKLGKTFAEGRNAEIASKKFDELRGTSSQDEKSTMTSTDRQLDDQTQRSIHFEQNILKIQERIGRRNKISAGCQMASGVGTMIASALTLAQLPILSAATGIVAFSITCIGGITTRIMKHCEYEKVVDEYFDLENIVEDRLRMSEKVREKDLDKPSAEKLRKQLRKQMLESCGFTSAKAFCSEVMKTYAKHIHSKLYPVENGNALPANERAAYEYLVMSLGLEIKRGITGRPGLPTEQMIYTKLMG